MIAHSLRMRHVWQRRHRALTSSGDSGIRFFSCSARLTALGRMCGSMLMQALSKAMTPLEISRGQATGWPDEGRRPVSSSMAVTPKLQMSAFSVYLPACGTCIDLSTPI